MTARIKFMLAAIAAAAAFICAGAIATQALAAGCGCIPPPCCAPPTPPTPPSPPTCCSPPGHTVVVPGVNVFVGASVVVNANVNAQVSANANTQAASQAGASTFVYSSGGAASYAAPTSLGLVQGLNVEGGKRRSAYEATRTRVRRVVIQAVCVDDREVPHPASQVTPDREIEDSYEGELYRCIAGTHMQYTIADFDGHISFEHGQTLSCAKGEALYHIPGGKGGGEVVCRPQKPARDCNERSLLRRFGAGVKILTIITVEKFTAYREEQTQSTASSMSLDGGVGGVMY